MVIFLSTVVIAVATFVIVQRRRGGAHGAG
jgi:hypothetical protein